MANCFAHDVRDLPVIRESPQSALGKNQIAVDRDLEDPVLALDQLDRGSKLVLQLSRQPGGPRLVISNYAVFDCNFHVRLRTP